MKKLHFSLKLFVAVFIVFAFPDCAKSSNECSSDCVEPNMCCDGLCINVSSNDKNCGKCGWNCGPGSKCVNGECVETCGDAGEICAYNEICCDGECVNVKSSQQHCGSCGHACGEEEACVSGNCERIVCEPPCGEGEICCKSIAGNYCANLKTDRNNCGQCGKVCSGVDEMCIEGVCSVEVCDPPCSGDLSCCGGTCVDKKSDPNNCGFCGNVCDSERSDGCTAGQCACMGALACRQDQKCCPGIGCRNIQADPSNCGDCGHQCAIGETCSNGECKCGSNPSCLETERCCSGTCIDVMSDPSNCGGCGQICNESGPECVNGQCMCGSSPACPWSGGLFACMSGNTASFQKCCNGECVPMSNENCGSCGQVCEEPATCTGIWMFQCIFSCQ